MNGRRKMLRPGFEFGNSSSIASAKNLQHPHSRNIRTSPPTRSKGSWQEGNSSGPTTPHLCQEAARGRADTIDSFKNKQGIHSRLKMSSLTRSTTSGLRRECLTINNASSLPVSSLRMSQHDRQHQIKDLGQGRNPTLAGKDVASLLKQLEDRST